MNALQDFVRFGIVGDLRLGVARREVERKLGSPPTWVGKPFTFGPAVHTPADADAWCYYDQAVTVRFDDQGVATSVSVFPERIKKGTEPFQHWRIGPGLRMCELRAMFVESQIDFDEGEDNEPGGYYILAERRCTAMSINRYEGGKLVPELKRLVSMIQTVSSDDELPSFVLRYWRRGRAPSSCG